MPAVFVSHSSVDKELVDDFVDDIISLGSEVGPEDIFYSSRLDTGVPSGQDLSAYVRANVEESSLVVALITPSFLRSRYCVAEMGAAWARAGRLFPLALPGLSHTELDGVLSGVAVRTMDDDEALDELHDRLLEVAGVQGGARTVRWSRHKLRWLHEHLPSRQGAVEPPGPLATTPGFDVIADDIRIEPSEQFSWGELFDSFVDAALYIRDDTLARTDIEHSIKAGRVIPSRYHYASDAGAKNWLQMCEEPTYRHHRNTTEYWASSRGMAMADLIRSELASPSFDFVSLGPGDGQKDSDLVVTWLAEGVDLIYYPYDISLSLAARSVQRVRERNGRATDGRLRVKAVLADFQQFNLMSEVFRHRQAPNIVGLLGTLGNLPHEMSFLRNLRASLTADDLVVLEVRLQSDDRLLELNTGSSLQHDFGPLEYYLGLTFDRELMYVERQENVSTVPGTETVVIGCRGLRYRDEEFEDVRLQYIHLYAPQAFLAAVANAGFDVIHSVVDTDGAFLECLIRRSGR